MDFIGGALPNVMFLIGVIAIGIGLGLEFQIIQVKNGLTRGGRIGAAIVGLALVVTSIFLYLRPTQTAGVAPAPGIVAAAAAAPSATALPAGSASAPTATTEPSATAEPPTATTAPATATFEVTATATVEPPTATAAPATATTEPTMTTVPATATTEPTATAAPAAATAAPLAVVPDVRGREPKEARELLQAAGLRLGEERTSCEDLGDSRSEAAEVRRGRIACQSAEPGASVPPQTAVDYVVVSEKGPGRDD